MTSTNGGFVDERALAGGSNPSSDDETTAGTFNITHSGDDTTSTLVVGGIDVTAAGSGGIAVTGIHGDVTVTENAGLYSYSYTLVSATTHPTANLVNTADGIKEAFAVHVVDSDGSAANTTLTIFILDDGPKANSDGTAVVAEDTPTVINVFTNDNAGADGVALVGGIAVATASTGGTALYNNDGTFTYTPNGGFAGADSFTYTITDADGDTSTATVNVLVPTTTT